LILKDVKVVAVQTGVGIVDYAKEEQQNK